MKKWRWIPLMVAFTFHVLWAAGQVGAPLLQNYPSEDYASDEYATSPQNWGIVQDNRGVMFFANSNNILAFDGTSYTRVIGTDDMLALKMAVDNQGIVYTGGKSDLGYIGVDSLGRHEFHSLKQQLPDSLQDFSRIMSVVADTVGAVYFVDSEHLFRYHKGQFRHWRAETRWMKAFGNTGRFIVQQSKKGLFTFEAEDLRSIPGSDAFDQVQVKALTKGKNATDFPLVATKSQGIFRYENGNLSHISSPLDSLRVWNGCSLPNGALALSTSGVGVIIINQEGEIERRIDKATGLQDEQTIFPYVDRVGNLWVGLNSGIARIEYGAPLTVFSGPQGIDETVYSMIRKGDKMYFGTSSGCFEMAPGNLGRPPDFTRIEGITTEVVGFIDFGDALLIGAADNGVFQYKNQQLTQLTDLSPIVLSQSKQDRNRIWIGLENGLTSLYFEENTGQWANEAQIKGIDFNVHHITEDNAGRIFASLWELAMVESTPKGWKVSLIDSSWGLTEEMGEQIPGTEAGEIRIGNQKGLFSVDFEQKKLVSLPDFKGQPCYFFESSPTHGTWLQRGKYYGKLQPQKGGKTLLDHSAFAHADLATIWATYLDPAGPVWVSTTDALYRYDPAIAPPKQAPFSVLIREVFSNDSVLVFGGNLPINAESDVSTLRSKEPSSQPKEWSLPYLANDITFRFAATSYAKAEETAYRYQLLGYDSEWSKWSLRTNKAYTNLKEGHYIFKVVARNAAGQLSDVATWHFRIAPPWYRTTLAYIIWGLLILVVFGLILGWNTRRIRRQEKIRLTEELARERAMLESFVEGQENERKRIAEDLHDGIQATLAAVKMRLAIVKKQLKARGIEEDFASEPIEMVADSIVSVRRISHDMMPASLKRRGLPGALKELCKRMDNGDTLKVNFALEENAEAVIPEKVALAVYRVAQELFANALKHAEASQIDVGLRITTQLLQLEFADNGKGFDLGIARSGLGLINMESRLGLVGGEMDVNSKIGAGAKFVVRVPLS